jgi:hypothetical protein
MKTYPLISRGISSVFIRVYLWQILLLGFCNTLMCSGDTVMKNTGKQDLIAAAVACASPPPIRSAPLLFFCFRETRSTEAQEMS